MNTSHMKTRRKNLKNAKVGLLKVIGRSVLTEEKKFDEVSKIIKKKRQIEQLNIEETTKLKVK